MGQYYYVPDPGEQRTVYSPPVPDRLAQLRQNQGQQPIIQPPQIPQPIQTNMGPVGPVPAPQNSGIIWVSGKSEADKWAIAAGSAVALWDQNNPVVYLRQADSTGKPSTKVYDLVERIDNLPQQPAQPGIDMTQYITRDELESILAERLKRSAAKPAKQKEDTENA